MRILIDFSGKIEDAEKDDQMRASGGAAAPVFDHLIRAAAPVSAPRQMRAGGGAAAPLRRRQYYSDSDGGYGYIRSNGF